MSILAAIVAALKLAARAMGWMEDKQLIDAGRAAAVKDSLQGAIHEIDKARTVERHLRARGPASKWARGVRDKYTRD